MAVTITASASGLEKSTPRALFEAPEVGSGDRFTRRQYAVLGNGERFLFNARYENAKPQAITVVTNWKAALKK